MEEIQSWLVNPEKAAIPKSIRHISIYTMYYGLPGRGAQSKQRASHYPMKVIGDAPQKDNNNVNFMLNWRAPRKPRDKAAEWTAIVALISQTTQLRSVTFACHEAMPLVLLQSIHNYPTVIHLNLASWTRASADMLHTDPTELELLGSPTLRSLQAYVSNPERNSKDLRLPAFWRLVRSAPNLQSLMLNISFGGCVIKWDTQEEIREWEVLAAEFERTTLSRGALPSSIRNLRITGGEISQLKDEELSSLINLDCSKSLPLQIIPLLTSLTHLTLRDYRNDKPIDDLLIACPPLTSLSVVGWRACLQLDTIFTQHGPALRALALHEFENTDATNPRQVLSVEDLHRIKDGCPHLEELSIDINFPEETLYESDHLTTEIHQEVYDALSTLPSLRRLQVNVNLGISTYNKQRFDQPRKSLPLADETFVKKVWAAVNHGRTESQAIQELRVAQGESQRSIGHGYPAGWVLWEQSTHHWFKATRSERDDEPDTIVISLYRDIPDFTEDLWRECRW